METETLLREDLELVNALKVAYLSTVDAQGCPQTRAVFNLRCRDAFPGTDACSRGTTGTSCSTSPPTPPRPRWRRSGAIRDVSVYYCRPDEFFGLMLTGRIEVVEDQALKSALWQEGWERYYAGGREDPDYTILRLRPSRMKGWHRGEPFVLDLPARS